MSPETFGWVLGGSTLVAVLFTVAGVIASVAAAILPVVGIFWYIARQKERAEAQRKASAHWRSTEGKILKSRVEVSGGKHTTVMPRIVYEYTVEGRRHESEQVRAGEKFLRAYTSKEAYAAVDRYPEGASVTVYYDPAEPGAAALER